MPFPLNMTSNVKKGIGGKKGPLPQTDVSKQRKKQVFVLFELSEMKKNNYFSAPSHSEEINH